MKRSCLIIAGILLSLGDFAATAATVVLSAPSEKPLLSSSGQPLPAGATVECGTFPHLDPTTAADHLLLLRTDWQVFGRTFTGPRGTLSASLQNDEYEYLYYPVYWLVMLTSDGQPARNDTANVSEYALFTNFTWSQFPLGTEQTFTTTDLSNFGVFFHGQQYPQGVRLAPYQAAVRLRELWGDYADLGGGWQWSAWLQFFWNDDTFPWIFHSEARWLYLVGRTKNDLWGWSPDLGWLFTAEIFYPYFYRLSNDTWYAAGELFP